MVGYFVPFEPDVVTSTAVVQGDFDYANGSYYVEPVAVRPQRTGVNESVRWEARGAPRPAVIRPVNSARGGDTRYHELRPP